MKPADSPTPDPLINVSELREFTFCERSWSLARQGFAVSPEALAQREAGIVFHEERATDAVKGHNPRTVTWILLLVAAAILLLLLYAAHLEGK